MGKGPPLAIIGGSEGIQPIYPAEGFLVLPLLLIGFLVTIPLVYCALAAAFAGLYGLKTWEY
jgi:hypothetical protein